jgi:Protein of unknown function (DUF3105)
MRRIAAAALVALLALSACSDDDQSDGDGTMPTDAPGVTTGGGTGSEPEGTETFTDLEQTHVDTPVDYPQTPPVGGPHNPVWQTCAFYDTAIMTERGVHSMEHGAVWVTYSPDLAADQVEVLKGLQAGGKEVLVSPFEGLPTPVVASAWGKQLQLESTEDPRLAEFVSYFDDGPQTPELNTPCAQGTDETVG